MNGHTVSAAVISAAMLFPDTLQEPGSLWFYAPNKGAPIAFAILFAISGATHFYQTLYAYSVRQKSSSSETNAPIAATSHGK